MGVVVVCCRGMCCRRVGDAVVWSLAAARSAAEAAWFAAWPAADAADAARSAASAAEAAWFAASAARKSSKQKMHEFLVKRFKQKTPLGQVQP